MNHNGEFDRNDDHRSHFGGPYFHQFPSISGKTQSAKMWGETPKHRVSSNISHGQVLGEVDTWCPSTAWLLAAWLQRQCGLIWKFGRPWECFGCWAMGHKSITIPPILGWTLDPRNPKARRRWASAKGVSKYGGIAPSYGHFRVKNRVLKSMGFWRFPIFKQTHSKFLGY